MSVQTILTYLISFLASSWLKSVIPANIRPYLEKFDAIAPLAMFAVRAAAEVAEADNAEKKRIASEHLLKNLSEQKIDIPGDYDLQVCELLVEGMYQALKVFKLTK